MIRHILVVCVGNICRSPMAEALLRDALKDPGWHHRGVGRTRRPRRRSEAAEHSIELMQERGLDITGHRARQITPEMVHTADLVLVMEQGHRRVLDANEPESRGKIYRLGEWQERDIGDPYQQPREAYEVALEAYRRWRHRVGESHCRMKD